MASVPQNSTKANFKSLKAGLAALKQGNVKTAIGYLESVLNTSPQGEIGLQARKGLVVAYAKIGRTDRAIALCRELSQSGDPQLQPWATQTLDRLLPESSPALNPPEPTPKPTGFIPFSPEEKQKLSQDISQKLSQKLSQNISRNGSQNPSSPLTAPTDFVRLPESPTPTQHDRKPPNPPQSEPPIESLDEPLVLPSLIDSAVDSAASPVPDSPPQRPQPAWRNSGRTDRPKPVKGSKIGQLRLLQVLSLFAVFTLLQAAARGSAAIANTVADLLPYGLPFPRFYSDPTPFLIVLLVLLAIASPWVLDALLRFAYGWKPLSLKTLEKSSPEATQLLRTLCRQKKISIPTLGIVPDTAPLLFTYGHLPATTRIVVSQGLLDRLNDDEIATLYAAELAHILYGDAAVLSLGLVLTQIPYTLYSKAAQFGDRLQQEAEQRQDNPYQFYSLTIAVGTVSSIAAIAYGIYWLLRLPFFPLSRQRLTESDRFAAATTGNPNGFARALLKLAIGIAQDIQQQEQTSHLLESFELVLPLSTRQALSLGSAYPHLTPEALLAWDISNPHRHPLNLNHSHPLLGERLAWLTGCAQFWKLQPEFDLQSAPVRRSNSSSPLWLQGAPYYGFAAGLGLGIALTLLGWLTQELEIRPLGWLFGDRAWLIPGLSLAGFSIGTLLRINPFFPDIKPTPRALEPNLLELLCQPSSLPIDSRTVRVTGKLIGRRGIANALGQDLILQTETLAVKLHHLSKFGPGGNLLPQPIRPQHWIGRELAIAGWWRRGATVWIDADTFKLDKTLTPANGHPLWSTILVALTAAASVYLIAGGGV